MSTTKAPKKALKKFALPAKKKAEPTKSVLVPMPPDWKGSRAHQSLAVRLENYLHEDKLFAAFEGAENPPSREIDIFALIERWLADRTDAERAEITTFASLIEWVDDSPLNAVLTSQAVVPACIVPVANPFCVSNEALREDIGNRLIEDPVAGSATISEDVEKPETPAAPADAPVPEADGQLPLVAETPKATKKITALSLDSSDDVASVRLALQARADDLEAKAKQLVTLGKTAEAFSLRKEVARLKEKIERQLSVQTAIAFNANESLPAVIARTVSGEIRSRARAALLKSMSIKKGESKQDAEERQRVKLDDLEALIGNIGEQAGAIVSNILVETAERSKEAGIRERNATPSQLAREAIHAIEAQRIQ